jgi:hypothetical protein
VREFVRLIKMQEKFIEIQLEKMNGSVSHYTYNPKDKTPFYYALYHAVIQKFQHVLFKK